MTTYVDRKIGALTGQTVEHRDCPSIPSWNASDRWNHHTFNGDEHRSSSLDFQTPSAQPLAYADDRVRAPPSQINSQFGPMQLPPYLPPAQAAPLQQLRANMEFGLYRLPAADMVLEMAPDQSRYAFPNFGDLGRMM
jgi:hypothetical protein